MAPKPAGTVTFLFTDIQGSTSLWEQRPTEMRSVLERHDVIVRDAISTFDGSVFSTAGDAFAAVFPRCEGAIEAAARTQRHLAAEPWPSGCEIKVRMGLHTGEATERGGDYYGPAVNRAARIMSAAHGGQVLLSQVSAEVAEGQFEFLNLGPHRLRDLSSPVVLHQLVIPGLRRDFPPPRTLEAVRHNLPVMRTSIIGRDDDVVEVSELVMRQRLVTLVGAGGVGKTTLALAVAGQLVLEFFDGVFLVELAPVSSGDLIGETVAKATGLRRDVAADAQISAIEAAIEALAGRNALIVLDNCEHLIDDAAVFVDELLTAGATARVLATSREPLSIVGEHAVRVRSLEIDSSDPLRCPAVQLVCERARSQAVELRYLVDNVDLMLELCRRLDGIPLALELAAAQLPHMTLRELVEHLDERLDVLTANRRARRLARHETLREVMAWSWDLLNDAERRLMGRLSVFVGGFTREGAHHVCWDPGDSPTDTILRQLVAKSMVVAFDSAGQTRFTLLETVRLFAKEHSHVVKDHDRRKQRHVAWLLERFDPGFETQYFSFTFLADYERELDNLRAGTDWSISNGDYVSAARLVCGGSASWRSSARWGLGLGSDEAQNTVRTLLGVELPDELRARVLMASFDCALDFSDPDMRAARISEAIKLATKTEAHALLATLQVLVARITSHQDPEEALRLMRGAAQIAYESGASHARAHAVAAQAFPLFSQNKLEQALDIATQAVELAAPAHYEMQTACWARFHAHLVLRDCGGAREYLRAGRAVESAVGLRPNWGWDFYETVLEAWCGSPQAARARLQELLAVLDKSAARSVRAEPALAAGIIALEEGDLQLAARSARAVSGQPLWNEGHYDVLNRFKEQLLEAGGPYDDLTSEAGAGHQLSELMELPQLLLQRAS